MNHKPENHLTVKLDRGNPFSGSALRMLWQNLVSREPATVWTKGRILLMTVTLVATVWALAGIAGLVNPGIGRGIKGLGSAVEGTEFGSGQDELNKGKPVSGSKLRNDLFKIPKPKNNNVKKTPKTNPVEMLGLIELQGVLGGKSPRAIILYKRTQKTSTVSVGDDLGEFTVVEIRDRSVILKWRKELFELSL